MVWFAGQDELAESERRRERIYVRVCLCVSDFYDRMESVREQREFRLGKSWKSERETPRTIGSGGETRWTLLLTPNSTSTPN